MLTHIEEIRNRCSGCNLQELCLPAGLQPGEIEGLEKLIEKRIKVKKNEHLIYQGDPARAIFAIKHGSLKSYRLTEDGSLQIVGIHLPGELFGFDALANNIHHISIQALESCNVCRLPLENLATLTKQIPSLSKQLMRITSRELNSGHDNHELLARRSAHERVALFICRYSDRRRNCGLEPFHFDMAISRQDLSNYLGLQLETVSRAFRYLRDAKLVNANRSMLSIEDPAGLKQLAGQCTPQVNYG